MGTKLFAIAAAMLAVIMLPSCGNGTEKHSAEEQPQQEEQTEITYAEVYDDTADPAVQVDEAVAAAAVSGKYVICQVGGNWCPWCLMLADFISKDEEIRKIVDGNFVYVHINVKGKDAVTGKNFRYDAAMKKVGDPDRFGFPVLVVLDGEGKVIHIQDSSYLEEGRGYNREKVLSFFKNWTPAACTPKS